MLSHKLKQYAKNRRIQENRKLFDIGQSLLTVHARSWFTILDDHILLLYIHQQTGLTYVTHMMTMGCRENIYCNAQLRTRNPRPGHWQRHGTDSTRTVPRAVRDARKPVSVTARVTVGSNFKLNSQEFVLATRKNVN